MASNQVVIGLGYGDEGKGLVTEYLVSKAVKPVVIRFSGGGQAGHNVVHDSFQHTFSNFGSGTYLKAPTIWTMFCPVEPVGLMNEYRLLATKGVNPVLYIDAHCPIVTPFDKLYSQTVDVDNGTVGVGIGATLRREERFYSLLMKDLIYPAIFRQKVQLIQKFYGIHVEDKELEDFYNSCHDVLELFSFTTNQNWKDHEDFIFEGSQGLMLDSHIGFFPHVTRSRVSTFNLQSGSFNFEATDFYMVTRAYQTRHGNGPMIGKPVAFANPEERNKEELFQGEFRTSYLNLDTILYAMHQDAFLKATKRKSLVITCLDVVRDNWSLYFNDQLVRFHSERKFIEFISDKLNVRHILTSHSPYSKNIKTYGQLTQVR